MEKPSYFNTKTPYLNEGEPEQKRQEILQYFRETYQADEHLFEVFADEKAMYRTADPLRHPLIFYFGHTATFYINKLNISKIINERINPKFESMFAIGVDEMSWDDLNQSHYNWPPVEEVRHYRKKVFERVDKLIRELPITLPVGWESPFWIILMAIEHSRIHLETSSVLIRQLPLDVLKPIPAWNICAASGPAPDNRLIDVEGGNFRLGKAFNHPLYGWDNEYGVHEAEVKAFKASKYLCSNGEYLQFIDDGGYQTEAYWSEEGWKWATWKKSGHPLFWRKTDNGWKLRLVFNEIDMPWNWPVEVNQLEAKAFCNWKAAQTGQPIRLLSEDEWYLLHDKAKVPNQPDWNVAPGNINMEHFQSPCPVDKFNFGPFFDLVGNVWQWTETPITGFEGFKIHPSYDDFSTPTFDMKHNLIKGGSWISTGNEATRDSRYAFRRHFYQHAGFRYVESEHPVVVQTDIYETDPEVIEFCETHYGEPLQCISNYQLAVAQYCIGLFNGKPMGKALDLGCKTGRVSWELAKYFDKVTGLDFTARMIRVAIQLQEQGRFNYIFPEEGELCSYHQPTLEQFGFRDLTGKVEFFQADASNMKPIFTGYDLILVNDILDQMYNPRIFLQSIGQRLNENGILVIATGFDWQPQFTKPENQIGGYRHAGEQIWGIDDMKSLLDNTFVQVGKPEQMLSILRQNRRKSKLKELQVTVWQKR